MKLEKIEPTTSEKTGKPYLKLTIDGRKFSYFTELPDGLVEGDNIECEFETKGKFTNIKSLRKSLGFEVPKLREIMHETILTRTDKPHSFEFGKASARHKVYYNTIDELKTHIKLLRDAGLIEVEEPIQMPMQEPR